MLDEFSAECFYSEWNSDFKLQLHKEISSTNAALMEQGNSLVPLLNDDGFLSENGKKFHHTVIVAESQTNGRGRLGRAFYSPSKTGIYFSFSVVQANGIKNPALWTVSACVGVCRAIEKIFGTECKIKWVNDIYCNEKKVCGILTEGIFNANKNRIEAVVVGIGINFVESDSFSDDLKQRAGGITDAETFANKKINRIKFVADCLKEINQILESGENIIDEYRKKSFLIGKELKVSPTIEQNKSFTALAIDITDDAGLLVKLADGIKKTLYSGEVTLHKL